VAVIGRTANDRPDHRVEAGTVAAAGENPDAHCPRARHASPLHVRRLEADESGDVARRDEDAVHAGALELRDVLGGRVA
jgi:hypothetical protein